MLKQRDLGLGPAAPSASVECLGQTFASEEERCEYFRALLREKLCDPAFRQIEGFPIGNEEDIIALSDPPYFTVCPNPFLEEFIRCYGKLYDPTMVYQREPLAINVSEGKKDPIYSAHGYHTKVPHKAIVRTILHYTEPGDIVLDGFAGSGQTGVAAQFCARPDPDLRRTIEEERRQEKMPPPRWGCRRVVLNDLGPAASFISAGYNLPFDVEQFKTVAARLLRDLEGEVGWMYQTLHTDGKSRGRINYTVWSEVFACPECGREVVFIQEALDAATKKTRDIFPCPHCSAELTKDNLQRLMETILDPATKQPWRRIRLVPYLINYSVGKHRYEKRPDDADLAQLQRIEALPLPDAVPTGAFPIEDMYHGSRLAPKGFTHVHHLFLPRAAQALGRLWATAASHSTLRRELLFFVEQSVWGMSVLARYAPTHFSQVNQYLGGVYYIGSQIAECSPWYILGGKNKRLVAVFEKLRFQAGNAFVTTGTAARIGLPETSIDYIFTDPPFGANIFYADLNYLVEAWQRVQTCTGPEAVEDVTKGKKLADYQRRMQDCFAEYYRVLKPGRWMTVVFHNSQNAVWNAIQEAIMNAGFVVADVRTLDKQQESYRQATSSAVKQDLVISAYKPDGALEQRFKLQAGSEAGAWDFVRTHLRQLPQFVAKGTRAETISERLLYPLYDRMVGFHVVRGVAVPLSLADFHMGLLKQFPERDGMYFLPEQVSEYDRLRLAVEGVEQLELFVSNEKTATQWIRRQLSTRPTTFAELQPLFMDLTKSGWDKHEQKPELLNLLRFYFIPEADSEEGAMGERWRIPDPTKEKDIEHLRRQQQLKEFEDYRATNGMLKVVRTEVIRSGFSHYWNRQDRLGYETIVEVGKRLPEEVLSAPDDVLQFYFDNALAKL